MITIKPKTLSRLAAVQGMYYHSVSNSKFDILISDIQKFYTSEFSADQDLKMNLAYFKTLLELTLNNTVNIDEIISNNLAPGWTLQKIHLTLLSILRVGAAELLYVEQTPFKVVINEFTNLASTMLMENEVAFVNSLLQKISNDNQQKLAKNDPFS